MDKPSLQTITYYEYNDALAYLQETYPLKPGVFHRWVMQGHPSDGAMLTFNFWEYLKLGRFDHIEGLREWFEALQEEFGDTVKLEFQLDEE